MLIWQQVRRITYKIWWKEKNLRSLSQGNLYSKVAVSFIAALVSLIFVTHVTTSDEEGSRQGLVTVGDVQLRRSKS